MIIPGREKTKKQKTKHERKKQTNKKTEIRKHKKINNNYFNYFQYSIIISKEYWKALNKGVSTLV